MPRITKEEVRASIQHREARKKTSRTLEEVTNEKKAKEELPYPITSEGLYTPAKDQEKSAEANVKGSAEVSNNNNQNKISRYPRTVEITGTGITSAKSSTEAAKEMKKEAVEKSEEIEDIIEQPEEPKKKYFAISAEDMQATNEKLIQLQKEKEELEATITLMETESSAIDSAEEGYKRKLEEKEEEYKNILASKVDENDMLRNIIADKDKQLQEMYTKNNKLQRTKKAFAQKLGEYSAYILSVILAAGALGAILLVVVKLLSAIWTWLF